MRVPFPLVVFLSIVSASAHAQTPTGNDIYRACRDVLDAESLTNLSGQGQCAGIVSATVYFLALHLRNEPKVCPPQGATNEQAIRVVVRYMEANPSKLGIPIYVLAIDALRSAWPCSTG